MAQGLVKLTNIGEKNYNMAKSTLNYSGYKIQYYSYLDTKVLKIILKLHCEICY